ncbi:MAG: hypothetical protein HY864_18845 [Chloroflexi bacterium]|nr:hypothetical protein [Chloroflexota bacterium]
MKKNRSLGCFIGTAVSGLILLCAGLTAWYYSQSQNQALRVFTQIRNPQSGLVAPLNNPIPLDVYVEGNQTVQRLEVYADGTLVGAANGAGQNVLTLAQTWTPATIGRHALVARAFFSAESFVDSSVVFVDVAELSSATQQLMVDSIPRADGVTQVTIKDLADAAQTTPEQILTLNPSLGAVDPSAVIPAGTLLTLPRTKDVPSVAAAAIPPPAPGAPGTPGDSSSVSHFSGETHSCSQISLAWTDAPDETAYALYRLSPGDDLMSLLSRLPANTTTFTDDITRIGTYRYFLAPVRPGGEGISSMMPIEIGPECSPAGTGATSALRLSLINLSSAESFEGTYCYVSVNGSRYERLPAEPNLLRPTSGNLEYSLPMQLPSRGQYAMTVPTDGLVRIDGECWGRRGAESIQLGHFSGSHASPEWDGRDLVATETASVSRSVASADAIPAQAGGYVFRVQYRIAPAGTRIADISLPNGPIFLPVNIEPIRGPDVTIPVPTNVRFINTVTGFCEPLPSTDPDTGTNVCIDQLAPRLAWDWNASGIVPQAAVTGFLVNVDFLDTTRTSEYPVNGPELFIQPGTARNSLPPAIPSFYRCGGIIKITVRAVTDFGRSYPSAPLELRRPACNSRAELRITVQSLTIGPSTGSGQVLDQGDICILCDDRRMELFGDLFIAVRNTAPALSRTPSHDIGTLLTGACPGGTVCVNEGQYEWGVPPHRVTWLFEMEGAAAQLQPLSFTVVIKDYDTSNGPDPFCVATKTLEPRTTADWARINETVELTSDLGEASCKFQINVLGLP